MEIVTSSNPSLLSENKTTIPPYSVLFSERFKATPRMRIKLAVTRLAAATRATATDQMLECYAEDLEDFDYADLGAGFTDAQREVDFMPSIAKMREMVYEIGRQRRNRSIGKR
jgi:hypothetical protein